MAAEREHEHVRVAVIGSGFGGLGAAVRLRRAGVTDFVVLERREAVGGTWHDNTYPGCACDVPSHLYSFSFAPNPDWPRNFSGQEHIRDYLEGVADNFGLRQHIRFNSEVELMSWDPDELRWTITTGRGHQYTADFVVNATGPLSDAKIPDIPGIEGFRGKVFHTAQWDHDYDLRGKRVAVIGTGASAIQVVPAIQPEVERLTLFQRTPAWVMPRADRKISKLERQLHGKVPATRYLRRQLLWAVRELQVSAFAKHPNVLGLIESLATAHMKRAVKDGDLRRKLTPDYRIGCKRILLSNSYYPALARPNVDLVASGLAEVRGSTLVAADGTEAEVDAVVFGTGFHVTDMPIAHRVKGARGTTLAEEWAGGMEALRGCSASGFPNFMTVIGPNTGLGNSSMILIIEAQLNYMVDYVRKLEALGGESGRVALDARPEAVEAWNAHVQDRMRRSVWNTGCDSWYLDANGRNTTVWPGTTSEFRNVTRELRLEEYEVLRQAPPGSGGTGGTSRRSVAVPDGRGAATAAFHAAEEG
ncbi:Predicted flavoprotein CzcO associated with the cation diffusion facilitator CzcD [Streptomyces sp. WMMB 714]|uniref:flavin-containing monooxygenase n=1 Tax=Streptomyces sp. WMMB 714 TaxID=1286822 RepID=UPI0005F83C71|nr:NAD(P)/FAD-dependent oxidoreductase [Streptomyces sp. WMMB 714]SCK38882.1 Predicted flavoprotein CzcO associated with the cation diffusion facilitator CzcD [Streptomyces sp. WMMB 714]